ncbi:MAG: HDOD domain-containing protein [Betaproteobacteria bacterium]|nr:HDOD domain-containing protein [Betaproteobacteria bacterium]
MKPRASLLADLWRRLTGRPGRARAGATGGASAQRDPTFMLLNERAPIKQAPAAAPGESRRPPEAVNAEAGEDKSPSLICREAILDRTQRVAAYEFMLNPNARSRIRASSERVLRLYDEVLVQHILDLRPERLLGHRLAFITLRAQSLDLALVRDLPRSNTVLALRFPDHAPDLPRQMAELKGAGFRLALDEADGIAQIQPYLELADFVALDASAYAPAALAQMTSAIAARSIKIRLIAKHLQSLEDFRMCDRLPFHYFQGTFVTSRESWDQPRADGSRAKLCELLNRVRANAAPAELSALLMRDPVLAYRFLRHVNSAAYGYSKVTTVDQGLLLLGRDKLYRWLSMLLFAVGDRGALDFALMENAVIRARLMETVGEGQMPPPERNDLFVTGMFSLLDVLFKTPMREVIKHLTLPASIEDALLFQHGKYAPYLKLAIAAEGFEENELTTLAAQCGVAEKTVNMLHLDALVWAQELAF